MAEAGGGAGADEDEIGTPGYTAPAETSIADMMKSDGKEDEDEALQRWKAKLLEGAGAAGGKKDVKVLRMELCCTGHDPIVLNLDDASIEAMNDKKKAVQVKEGTEFHVKIYFGVSGEVVSGLKYAMKMYKGPLKVGSDEFMLGSYGPKAGDDGVLTEQIAKTKSDEFPSGMLARTTVKVVSKFRDDDKTVWKEWTWYLKVAKDFA